MDEKILQQIIDGLFPAFEAVEAQSAAILRLIKDKNIASDEEISHYLDEAGKTSDVRWRGIKVRMNRLLLSLDKAAENADEKKKTESENMSETTDTIDKAGTGNQNSDTSAQEPAEDSQESADHEKATANKESGAKVESIEGKETKPDQKSAPENG